MKKAWKWTLAILAALAVMIAAGMAGAENTIALNNPQTVNITIPGDIILYEYTPQVSGVYRFYAYSEETEDWADTYGYLLDEDGDLLDSDDDDGEGRPDGHDRRHRDAGLHRHRRYLRRRHDHAGHGP